MIESSSNSKLGALRDVTESSAPLLPSSSQMHLFSRGWFAGRTSARTRKGTSGDWPGRQVSAEVLRI